MDKETLSNYGWIVICVLVLSVMIALASPFGKFVSDAVKSTTAGLFGVNQEALGAAGIVIDDQAFCDHTNTTEISASNGTESEPGHDAYSVCADCGKVMTEDGEIPYRYTDFYVTNLNRAEIGYTDETTNLIIPETFRGTDGKWYKVVGINANPHNSSGAFSSCTNLISVTMPDTIVALGSDAFNGCTNLKTIKLSESLTDLGCNTFYNCINLESINIPKGVTIIVQSAFQNCKSIKEIVYHENIARFSLCAMYNCESLETVVFEGTVEQWKNIYFDGGWSGGTSNFTIHCTDGCLNKSNNSITCSCTDHTD